MRHIRVLAVVLALGTEAARIGTLFGADPAFDGYGPAPGWFFRRQTKTKDL